MRTESAAGREARALPRPSRPPATDAAIVENCDDPVRCPERITKPLQGYRLKMTIDFKLQHAAQGDQNAASVVHHHHQRGGGKAAHPHLEQSLLVAGGELLGAMLAQMAARGPDSAGLAIYRDPAPAGHTKLSLYDEVARRLSAPHHGLGLQPASHLIGH